MGGRCFRLIAEWRSPYALWAIQSLCRLADLRCRSGLQGVGRHERSSSSSINGRWSTGARREREETLCCLSLSRFRSPMSMCSRRCLRRRGPTDHAHGQRAGFFNVGFAARLLGVGQRHHLAQYGIFGFAWRRCGRYLLLHGVTVMIRRALLGLFSGWRRAAPGPDRAVACRRRYLQGNPDIFKLKGGDKPGRRSARLIRPPTFSFPAPTARSPPMIA